MHGEHPQSYVEIDTCVYNKVPLWRLYYGTRNRSILLIRTVNMQQLWLSYPELGICIPNFGRFKQVITYPKWRILQDTFIGQ